ncbi:DUF3800 domain-containing protein [Sinorhizobium fredii]|uniref:DUF3800 domain-containing protein n=1 Tax=Rhizobium fredii TaxID=380 RepID=UPI0009B6FAAC|nr:DUF3800 domain-containing protein [Sinorhizobium fredii]WOS64264.1 DUF3800 domain-containing protein [Sinorhizobium fredii GR64]
MLIACDEAGHTGPDLLAKDQRYFAFASVNISDEEAWAIIAEARKAHPVQMPELKASKLMASKRGQRLISHIVKQLEGRFAVNAHDKLLALCGWVFEYIVEPVYQHDPRIFYRKDFHRFIAMFCYLWFLDERSEAADALAQFQAYMRSKDISQAPILFDFKGGIPTSQPHPFELIQRFATGYKDVIARDNANIEHHTSDKGTWTLDLSASGLWSHLNHWGKQKKPLTVICDDSKPLRAIAKDLDGDGWDATVERARVMFGHQDLGWEFERPIEFVDSRAHPSVQLADILASTVVYCYSNGLPEGMEATAELLEAGMLRDSIFPDLERVRLENDQVKVHYAVLYELAATAEGHGTGAPIDVFYEIAEQGVASGELSFG